MYIKRQDGKIIEAYSKFQRNKELERIDNDSQELKDFYNKTGDYDMRTVQEKRAEAYPPEGDVIDEVCKALDYIIESLNIQNCEEYKAIQAVRKTVKDTIKKD